MKLQKTPNDLHSKQMFLGGAQSANFNEAGSSPQLIRHAGVGICRSKLWKKAKKPGSGCVKNPFTTWRPTKEIMSPWQSDTPAPLWRARLQRAADLLSSPATCRPPWFLPTAPPYLLLPSADFTPRKRGLESRACRLGTAFIIQWQHAQGFSVIDVC